MKDVIKELVEIDEQAKLYNEETKRKKEALEKKIEEETKNIHDTLLEKIAIEEKGDLFKAIFGYKVVLL